MAGMARLTTETPTMTRNAPQRTTPRASQRLGSATRASALTAIGRIYGKPLPDRRATEHQRSGRKGRRIFGAHAPHLAAVLLRSSLTHQRVGSLRSSAHDHDLGHLATKSLASLSGRTARVLRRCLRTRSSFAPS